METVTTSTNKEVEIDLLELFQVMLKHWKSLIASMVLLGAIFGLFTKFTFTPEYEAASELYVLSKSTSITSLADIQVGTSLTNDYEYVITGRTVLSTVIKNLGLKDTYEELKARVTIENPTDTRVIRIVVNDNDIEQSKQIADEIANVSSAYIADNMDQAQPKKIQSAYASSKPVNNNILRNTLIGALLGLLLALGLATIQYLLDDSVSNADDLEKKTGMKVLAPHFHLKIRLSMMAKRKRRKRRRLYKYGNSDHKSDKETKLYNERIPSSSKNKHKFQWKGDKIDPFASSVPNEGKSTVVMDLARSMADSKRRCS